MLRVLTRIVFVFPFLASSSTGSWCGVVAAASVSGVPTEHATVAGSGHGLDVGHPAFGAFLVVLLVPGALRGTLLRRRLRQAVQAPGRQVRPLHLQRFGGRGLHARMEGRLLLQRCVTARAALGSFTFLCLLAL